MKVAELLTARRRNWSELETLCEKIASGRAARLGSAQLTRFGTLYRAVCADLALADAYQLPPDTVQYLHRLVGRAHNTLYRTRRFDFRQWGRLLLVDAPRAIFGDRCVQLAFVLFWGAFLLSALLGTRPGFDRDLVGAEYLEKIDDMHSQAVFGRDAATNNQMAAFYIKNNTGIGLQCFALGILVVPGLLVMLCNACQIGAIFGHMTQPGIYEATGVNFFHFVTAHGPCELTAIVLASGAGLRLGVSWIITGPWSRGSSLRKAGQEAIPIMCAAVMLFFLAAFIEGFISPSSLPYSVKAFVAALSSSLLIFYFVALGLPAPAGSAAPRASINLSGE